MVQGLVMLGICRLCENNKELRSSHLMPSAFYNHILKSSGKPPISASPTIAVSTSKQIRDYLLCADCEDRFNKRGEKWVLENYPQINGKFPIQEALFQATPFREVGSDKDYNGNLISSIDLNKLTYFATSIFWRAAAHNWQYLKNQSDKLSLGLYEEMLRQYLLDQAQFPKDVVLSIYISPSANYQDGVIFPHTYRTKPFHAHGFSIPGVLFALSVGKAIPIEAKQECAIHSNILRLTLWSDKLALEGRKNLKTSLL
jgi:hypothetical protein